MNNTMHTHSSNGLARGAVAGLLLALALAGAGCASIVHSGKRDVSVRSEPLYAKVDVYRLDSKKGNAPVLVSSETTPCLLSLKPGAGFFKGQAYRLTFTYPGHAPASVELQPKVSGWYFGNIVFGGLIGLLIVDPATGAMWNLSPEEIAPSLTPAQAQMLKNGEGFFIKLASETTPAETLAMVRIQ